MKTKDLFFICLTLFIITRCANRQGMKVSGQEYITKEGIILFAPILNVAYFFPFKNDQSKVKFKNWVSYEYDSGFIMIWPKAKWRNTILDNFAEPILNNNTYKYVAFAYVEYSPLIENVGDSLNSLTLEYSGIKMDFEYDYNEYMLKMVKGLKYIH